MSTDNASIAYASLLGDQSDVDIQTKNDYRGSGIAHILSISGLHISVLVGFIFWILNRLKASKLLSFILIASMLLLYSYLCGFSPSVMRASIMSICLLGAGLTGRKYDTLSAIGFAGLIILLITPLAAYDISFQLSFGSIIGIALFFRSIKSALLKLKLSNFWVSSFAISISAQLLIMPILINAFGGASILSVFINVFVVPIFSFAYVILFLCMPLIFISNFFAKIFWLPSLLFEGINICANFVASLEWSIIPKIDLSFAAITIFFAGAYISSRFVFLSTKLKVIINSSLALLVIILTNISSYTQITI